MRTSSGLLSAPNSSTGHGGTTPRISVPVVLIAATLSLAAGASSSAVINGAAPVYTTSALQRRDDRLAALSSALPTDLSASNTVDGNVVLVAGNILDMLPEYVPLPACSASDEGEIGMSWFKDGNRFEVMVGPGRTLAWVTTDAGSYMPGGEITVTGPSSVMPLIEAVSIFFKEASIAAA